MSDDETQGGNEVGQATTRRARGPAPTFEYRVFLDGHGAATVGDWEATRDGESATELFCEVIDGIRQPRYLHRDDLICIATAQATDREAAVSAILKGDVDTERAKVVRAAHEAHVDLDFKVLSSSKIGEVPVHWKIVPSFSIGAKG